MPKSDKLYFLSTVRMDNKMLEPRVPENFMTKNGYEDKKTKRVCFSLSVDGAIMALSRNCKDLELYVHVPTTVAEYTIPTKKQVPDSELTSEVWVKKPVQIHCIGKIKCGEAKQSYNYTFGKNDEKSAQIWSFKWRYLERFKSPPNTKKIDDEEKQTTESTIYTENVLINKNNLYIKFDKFESGKSNILLITGLSGSGKSTLSSQLANKYHCENFELDALDFYVCGKMNDSDCEKGEPGLLEFMKHHKPEKNGREMSQKEIVDLYNQYIPFLINWCSKQKDKKFIIEGLQLYEIFDKDNPQSYFKSTPMIIMGTSGITSAIRAAKRNDGKFLNELPSLIKWALQDNKMIENLKDYLKESTLENDLENMVIDDKTHLKYSHEDKINFLNDAIKNGGYYGENGIWNSIITFPNDKHIYRGRVETLIIKDDKYIFLKFIPKDNKNETRTYLIPGGSFEKDTPNIEQAVNECKEEARIIVKNIQSTGITYNELKDPPKWAIGKQPVNWNGNYTEVYVGEYDHYFNGHIDKEDIDKFMASGRFYELDKVYHYLKKEHKEALTTIYPNIINSLKKSAKMVIIEKALSTKERDALPDSAFGIPSERKFPLIDKNHVISAIRYFNTVDKKHEKELAYNIIKAMKKFNIPNSVVGERNRLRTYLGDYFDDMKGNNK